MKLIEILNALFPAGHEVGTFGQLIAGTAQTSSSTVAVLGTTDAAAIGHDIALGLAGRILDIVDQHPGRPIVFLVDTKGQALSRAEELLCLNGSLAHLARCVDLARRQGHVSVALVTGEAVSGGFLSFGLMADKTYALADAQVRRPQHCWSPRWINGLPKACSSMVGWTPDGSAGGGASLRKPWPPCWQPEVSEMRRHDLAYVRPGAAVRFHCGIADEELSARVMGWIVRGRPLVVARQVAGSDALLLGLTLPATSEGRRRVGCFVKRAFATASGAWANRWQRRWRPWTDGWPSIVSRSGFTARWPGRRLAVWSIAMSGRMWI